MLTPEDESLQFRNLVKLETKGSIMVHQLGVRSLKSTQTIGRVENKVFSIEPPGPVEQRLD